MLIEHWKCCKLSTLKNVLAIEGLSDWNGHIQLVVGDGKSGRWVGALGKVKGRKCKIERNMFLYSDLLKFYMRQYQDITKLFPDTIVFLDDNNSRY